MTRTAVTPFFWLECARVLSHRSSDGLPQENPASSWAAVSNSGPEIAKPYLRAFEPLPFFDARSSREPLSGPDRARGGLALENALLSHGAARRNSSNISGTAVAGLDKTAVKALKPAELIRIGIVSIRTSSAAR